jgi:hypothetical protein
LARRLTGVIGLPIILSMRCIPQQTERQDVRR